MKHTIKAAAATLAVATLLAACGRADGADTTAAGTADAISDGAATGTIEIWTAGGYGENLGTIVEDFTTDNPDADVEITDIPWGELVTKIQTAVAAGTAPDAVMIGSSQMAQIISTGGLAEVPDGLVDLDAFFPDATEPATAQGTLYGLPWYVETRVLYYRADIAEAAGVEAPTTWDQMTDFLAALQEQDGVEYAMALPVGDAEDSTQVIVPFLAEAGGSLLDESGESWTLDTPEMAEALDYYGSFFLDGYAPTSGYGDEQNADFVSGANAAFISGQWMVGVFADLTSEEWVDENVATVPVPAGSANNASYLGGAELAVFSDADNADGAWKLIQWLVQPETQQAWYDLSGDLPSVESAWDYDAIQSNTRNSVIQEQLASTVAPPAVPAYDELSGIIESVAEEVANGLLTGDEAAAQLQEQADALGLGW